MFVIDIDNTILAETNEVPMIVNRMLSVGVPASDIERMTCLRDFQQHPLVMRYVDEHGTEEIERITSEAYNSEEYLRTVQPLPHAVEALKHIAQRERIIYATCRPQSTHRLTQHWLAEHGFPFHYDVFCCAYYHSKYIYAYQRARNREPIIIIDDQANKIIESFLDLIEERRHVAVDIVARLAVVHFHNHTPPITRWRIPFVTSYLSSWNLDEVNALHSWLYNEIIAA